jgi:hypothetical protein
MTEAELEQLRLRRIEELARAVGREGTMTDFDRAMQKRVARPRMTPAELFKSGYATVSYRDVRDYWAQNAD